MTKEETDLVYEAEQTLKKNGMHMICITDKEMEKVKAVSVLYDMGAWDFVRECLHLGIEVLKQKQSGKTLMFAKIPFDTDDYKIKYQLLVSKLWGSE